MPLDRSESSLNEFLTIATKYQARDENYQDLSHTDGVFNTWIVERAYIIFLSLRFAAEDSKIKKAFNAWRSFHYGESKALGIFFEYVKAVLGDEVTYYWDMKLDCKARNIETERECLCRIFILSGLTAQMKFNQFGASQ